jgi:hypothetical protein
MQVYVQTQPLIRSVLDGYNVCIFAYGQTGSGKTHTMSGTDINAVAGRGINYRALDDLFDIQHQRRGETTYEIKVQMLEVYNEKVCRARRSWPCLCLDGRVIPRVIAVFCGSALEGLYSSWLPKPSWPRPQCYPCSWGIGGVAS